MITSREELITALSQYQTLFREEALFCKAFLDLLSEPRCYERDFLPGHITGSAWIIDESHDYALLTHHTKLNRWLQPGGHADGDENIFNVALREAEEETGLKNLASIFPGVFDIDIHLIPERKEFPAHLHYDVRFIFEASRNEPLVITAESNDLKWVALDTLNSLASHDSMVRMQKKTSLI